MERGGVEFAAAFALGRGEFADEIFIDAADQVEIRPRAVEFKVGEHLDQAGDDGTVKIGFAVDFWQGILERGVGAFDFPHGIVDLNPDIVGLGSGGKAGPAGLFGHPEDVFGRVFLGVFGVDHVVLQEFLLLGVKGGRDIAQEDQAKGDMLVFAGVHGAAHLVGSGKEGFLNRICHRLRWSLCSK